MKPARPSDRLVADEVLNQIGSWARAEKPDLGEYIQPLEIEFATRAYYVDAYEGGEEDHMIALSLRYKVNPF